MGKSTNNAIFLRDSANEIARKMKPIRARREHFASDVGAVMQILRAGTERARNIAAQTLSDVRTAMLLNYL